MLIQHQELFDSFKQIHDSYLLDPDTWRSEFNIKGEEILEVIRKYEGILTSRSDNSSYGKFSTNLSEKFWAEIKKTFPKIDFIGVT